MPPSYINEIKAGESTISQLEILQGNVAADNHLLRMIGEDIKRTYRKDNTSTTATANLISFMNGQSNLVDKFELAKIYFSLKQYTNMATVLSNISNMELNEANQLDYTNFALMMNTLKLANENNKASNFLNEAEVADIETVLYANRSLTSSTALALLMRNNPEYQFEEIVLDMSETSSRMAEFSEEITIDNANEYRIYPNPSNDYIMLEYNPKSDGDILYRISNSNGKIVLENTLEKSESDDNLEVLIDLQELSAGVYYFNLINNKQNLRTQKLVILK